MKKGTILFCPIYFYLSLPLFKKILPYFEEYKNNLIFMDEGIENFEFSKLQSLIETSYQDYSYYRVAKKDFKKIYNNRIVAQLLFVREVKRKIHQIQKEIDILRPDAIVTNSDSFLGARILKQCLCKKNIPFIVLQPSFINLALEFPKMSLSHRVTRCIYNSFLGAPLLRKQLQWGLEDNNNQVVLWGDFFKELFLKYNYPKQNLFVTGTPIFDKSINLRENGQTFPVCNEQKQFKHSVAICTAPHNNDDLLQFYKQIIESNPEIYFIVKVHPRECIDGYNTIFSDCKKKNYCVMKDMALSEVFRSIDIQVSVNSTTSFEAVVANIPIILINPENNIKFHDFFLNLIELRASNIDEFNHQLKVALSEDYMKEFSVKREKYLKEMLYLNDGHSAERIADCIKSIIHAHKGDELHAQRTSTT